MVAVGNGNRDESGRLIALDVKKGNKVLFEKWGGTEIKIDGKELIMMKESAILAVIE